MFSISHRMCLALLLGVVCSLFSLKSFAANVTDAENRGPELDPSVDYYVVLHTGKGKIVARMLTKEAPITTRSFINLTEGTRPWYDEVKRAWVRRPYYNGLTFHRISPGFMIQGGDPRGNGSGGPGFSIPAEFSSTLKHVPGTFSMARTSDPNSAGSQFFICDGSPAHLDGQYAIFGQTVEGVEVVSAIAKGDANGDRALTPVRIERAEVIRVKAGSDPQSKPWTKPELIVKRAAAAAPAKTTEGGAPIVPAKSETNYGGARATKAAQDAEKAGKAPAATEKQEEKK